MDIEDFNFKTTIVSFYFDITKLKDVTNKIRPKSFYMEKGRQLLHLPYPMVLFCDNITINEIKHIREQELGIDIANKLTYYIIKNIIDYDLYKIIGILLLITENRILIILELEIHHHIS